MFLPGAPVQFRCAHCTSSRCLVHTGRPPTRSRGCGGIRALLSCASGLCETNCASQLCSLRRRPVCSFSVCGEVPSPGCACETHCAHPQCSPLAFPPLPRSVSRPYPNSSLLISRNRSCSDLDHPVQHSALHRAFPKVVLVQRAPRRVGGGTR